MSKESHMTAEDIYKLRQKRLDVINKETSQKKSERELKASLKERVPEVLEKLEESIILSFNNYAEGRNSKFDNSDDFTIYAQLVMKSQYHVDEGVKLKMEEWSEIRNGLNQLLEKYQLALQDEDHRSYRYPTEIDGQRLFCIGFIFYVKLN